MCPLLKLLDFDLSLGTVATLSNSNSIEIKEPNVARRVVTLPSGFPEATLFCLIKALFGRPNGLMSIALGSEGDASAPFKYEWVINLPDGSSLSIIRNWLTCEVHSKGREIELQEIVSMFTYNFKIHEVKIAKTLESLEPYRLVINPHYRHRAMMRFYSQELKKTDYSPPKPPASLLVSKRHENAYTKQLQNYLRGMARQNAFAVSVVTESAFVAESYLNLLIGVLRNDTLADHEEMLRTALQEKWRAKIQRLPLHCSYFLKSPDMEASEIKELKRVFDLRNKIAHSFPDVDDLCTATIWFDLRVPVLPKCEAYVLYQAGADALLPTRDEALGCPHTVTKFIEYINSLLIPSIAAEMQAICNRNPIGYSERTKRYGIPFTEEIAMAFFGTGPAAGAPS